MYNQKIVISSKYEKKYVKRKSEEGEGWRKKNGKIYAMIQQRKNHLWNFHVADLVTHFEVTEE